MEKDCLKAVNTCYQTFKIACKKSADLSEEKKASLEEQFDKMDDVIYKLMVIVGLFSFSDYEDDEDDEEDEGVDFPPPHSRN